MADKKKKKMSGWEALSILGATMQDVSSGLRGQPSDYVPQYLKQQEEQQAREAMRQFMMGGEASPFTPNISPQLSGISSTAPVIPNITQAGLQQATSPLLTGMPSRKLGATKYSFGGITYEETPESKAERDLWIEQAKEGIKIKGETQKKATEYEQNLYQTISLVKNMISQIKGKEEEQRGLGLLPGMRGGLGVMFKDPRFARTASAPGQRVETALRFNSMLTGQNRVIRSVVNMIMLTLPSDFDPAETVANKTAQTIRNIYGLAKSFKKAGLSPEKLNEMSEEQLNTLDARSILAQYTLTNAEEKEVEVIIKDVLSAPMQQRKTLLGERGKGIPQAFNSIAEAEKANLPKGTIITIGGRRAVVE